MSSKQEAGKENLTIKNIKNLSLPPIGMRNIKTALAVLCCLILYALLDRSNASLACIAAVICMQDSIEGSIKTGWFRIIGTVIGGVFGGVMLMVSNYFGNPIWLHMLLTGIGVVLVIYLCNLIHKSGSIVISCVVLIMILTSVSVSPFVYAFHRVLDTVIGICISVVINRTINFGSQKAADLAESNRKNSPDQRQGKPVQAIQNNPNRMKSRKTASKNATGC